MGVLDTSVAWIKSFTGQRTAPTNGSQNWPTKPADNLMKSTNDAADMTWVRKWVADGTPSRTKPPSATDSQPVTPNPLDVAFQRLQDKRGSNIYPKTNEGVTNYSAVTPSRGRDLPYGVVSLDTGVTSDRPGSTIGMRPADPTGGAKRDADK
jgi:hypothetical protein